MKVLVTGANGQVGWELRKSLAPLGEVIAMDRKSCDLTRPAEAARTVIELRPDIIVNAAAYTAVDKAEEEEPLATLINGTAVGEIADAARKIGSLLIHYSTDYVFDGTKSRPYTEDDPPCPINAYGRSKLAGERALEEVGGQYLLLRTSWIYAARGRNFLLTILRLARERDALRVVNDQIGAPTWARELAQATALIARRAVAERGAGDFASGRSNITAAGETSWFGFAEAVVEEAARGPALLARKPAVHSISSREYPAAAARPKNCRLAGDYARRRFEFAMGDWKQCLRKCLSEMASL